MSEGYIHGTTPSEQTRLSRLNHLLNAQSYARLQIRPGMRVLDVGCGLGQLARMMARTAGRAGAVVGVERSSEQIARGRILAGSEPPAPPVDLREGDALALPLAEDEWGTFDLVHARFLLEHVSDPQRVVDAMVRALGSGGRIVLEDDDHDILRLHPDVPAFRVVWGAYMRTYTATGRDPVIGRRLPELIARAGARPTRNDTPFFGACQGSASFEVIVPNCRSILVGARDAILQHGGVTSTQFDEGLAAYDAWSALAGAGFWYCSYWAEGVRE